MNREEAILEVLQIYAETDRPVSQKFYQGLCLGAKEEIKRQAAEIEELQALNEK